MVMKFMFSASETIKAQEAIADGMAMYYDTMLEKIVIRLGNNVDVAMDLSVERWPGHVEVIEKAINSGVVADIRDFGVFLPVNSARVQLREAPPRYQSGIHEYE